MAAARRHGATPSISVSSEKLRNVLMITIPPSSRKLTIAGIEQRRSLGRAAAVVQGLSPGYFAFVMATSIISTGTLALGPSWLSRVLLVIAVAAALAARIVAGRRPAKVSLR
jgi:hypothetical protein